MVSIMVNSFRKKLAEIGVSNLVNMVLLLCSSVFILLNLTVTRSWAIGIPASGVLLYVGSVTVGKIFHSEERVFLRGILGFACFILFIALSGTVLILLGIFGEVLSVVLVISMTWILFFGSLLKGGLESQKVSERDWQSDEQGIEQGAKLKTYSLMACYIISLGTSFYTLILGRTTEGGNSVWVTIPSLFLPVFFLSSLFLALILFFTPLRTDLKLVLIAVYSFSVHSLFLLVWYPGRYGDPWIHLGEARYIDKTGMMYAYAGLVQRFRLLDLVAAKAHYALIVFLRRLFFVDIYWVQVNFIPLIWSILVPVFSYKITDLLVTKAKTTTLPIVAAVVTGLFSTLVYWGAITVPNSLGFLFFFFSVLLTLRWIHVGRTRLWFLSALAFLAAFFVHPQPGVFSLMFIVLATAIQKSSHVLVKVASYPLAFSLFPLALWLREATFSLEGLVNIDNFVSFQANFASVLIGFGLLGLIWGLWHKKLSRKNAILVFILYVTVVSEFYLTMYGMENLPFGPGRIMAMADFLLVPFVAMGLLGIVGALKEVFSGLKPSFSKRFNIGLDVRSVGLFMVCLFLSSQALVALRAAYPIDEIVKIQPRLYELEAIYYIDSTTPPDKRFVTLCHPQIASLAIGFLGPEFSYQAEPSHGTFGGPEWDWPITQMYREMCRKPSFEIMEEAMRSAFADVCYFVVSQRNPEGFETVLSKMYSLLDPDMVFGNGELYVYKYPVPVVEGEGSEVRVAFDDGASIENVTTWFEYCAKSNVRHTLTLQNHRSYNISGYPKHWALERISKNLAPYNFNETSNINDYIYIDGAQPDELVKIYWRSNENYPKGGWKEDSFKDGWQTHPLYPGSISPTITSDGNILEIYHDFVLSDPPTHQYYYYTRSCQISTSEYPWILVRWKSTGVVAVVAVAYSDNLGKQFAIVPFNSLAYTWEETIVQLEPGKEVAYVMVGITNLGKMTVIEGPRTVSVDYILLCAEE